MKVTDIIPASGKFRILYVDFEPECCISLSCLKELGIRKDEDIDQDLFNKVKDAADRCSAAAAMDILLKRDLSEKDLRLRLKKKGFMDEQTDHAIGYVKSYHYIDDLRYAVNYAAGKKGRISRQMLYMKLREKGIADDLIDAAVMESSWDDRQSINNELRKKIKGSCDLSEYTDDAMLKLIRSLIRKGYSYGDITKAIRQYSA